MTQEEIRKQLEALSEEKFRKFSTALLPGVENMLGVRLPLLRKLSRTLAKDWRGYLETARDDSFEETMLQGMVVGCADMELTERFEQIAAFVPKINNWSVCDSFCAGLHFAKDHQAEVWEFLKKYRCGTEFEIRFALVMMIYYFLTVEYVSKVLLALDGQHQGYYVKMAQAWAVSMCYVRFPALTEEFLEQCSLDDFTYHKALQKITESNSVDAETKKNIRSKKRSVLKG